MIHLGGRIYNVGRIAYALTEIWINYKMPVITVKYHFGRGVSHTPFCACPFAHILLGIHPGKFAINGVIGRMRYAPTIQQPGQHQTKNPAQGRA